MPVHQLADMTWEEVRDARDAADAAARATSTRGTGAVDEPGAGRAAMGDPGAGAVAVLPVGAVEAHGPHLPLGTDVLIAQAMARACGAALGAKGRTVFLLPPVWYSAAPFARAFAGTIDIAADTLRDTVLQIAGALFGQGIRTLALANAHLDPAHVAALREAETRSPDGGRIVFLDLTRRRVADRLTEEFRTGACHAGRFEGSVVLAEAPGLFRSGIAAGLAPNPSSLSEAIRDGNRSFGEAGGDRAYFGWPAEASVEEGRATVETLGALLAEAVETDPAEVAG